MNTQEKSNALHSQQVENWPLLRANWEKLDAARVKAFDFGGFTIQVQFNPKRITSSAAKVDKASIEKRPCFLCRENQPPEEVHVSFMELYQILCNPFPIFRRHFTIASNAHIPQVIDGEFSSMLELSRALPELAVFYNAPACGASAPDHMHFQAGERDFMPIEGQRDFLVEHFGRLLVDRQRIRIRAVDDGLRRFFLLESPHRDELEKALSPISAFMRERLEGEEPMLNILSYFQRQWQVYVFPRDRHRPWQFFEEGEGNILLSPASVDMGGMLITPLEKDFMKIGEADIRDIFTQISLDEEAFVQLSEELKSPEAI